ncbi:MAG: hypothetical protein HOY79_03990 [Streptomyces sp.]|nr:hypothetical protein [Streptomyces sp.]
MRVLTAADVAEARHRPEAVARRHGLDPATLKKLLAGELDTVLGGCTDHLASPHSPAGEPCRASFLLCLSCPCARATPAHLPVLIAVQDGLEARKQEMTSLRWAERFAGPVAQLADLLASLPTTTIATKWTTSRRLTRELTVPSIPSRGAPEPARRGRPMAAPPAVLDRRCPAYGRPRCRRDHPAVRPVHRTSLPSDARAPQVQ